MRSILLIFVFLLSCNSKVNLSPDFVQISTENFSSNLPSLEFGDFLFTQNRFYGITNANKFLVLSFLGEIIREIDFGGVEFGSTGQPIRYTKGMAHSFFVHGNFVYVRFIGQSKLRRYDLRGSSSTFIELSLPKIETLEFLNDYLFYKNNTTSSGIKFILSSINTRQVLIYNFNYDQSVKLINSIMVPDQFGHLKPIYSDSSVNMIFGDKVSRFGTLVDNDYIDKQLPSIEMNNVKSGFCIYKEVILPAFEMSKIKLIGSYFKDEIIYFLLDLRAISNNEGEKFYLLFYDQSDQVWILPLKGYKNIKMNVLGQVLIQSDDLSSTFIDLMTIERFISQNIPD